MNPTATSINGLASILLFSAVAVLFGWGFRRVATRGNATVQTGAWLGGAAIVAGLMTMRVRQMQTVLGLSPEQQSSLPVFWWIFPMWVVALGAVVLLVRRDIRHRAPRSILRTTGRILGIFWLGTLVYLIAFAILDVIPSLIPVSG